MSDFICAICEKTFEKGRSDEEAAAECEELWGAGPQDIPCDVFCDICWRQFMGLPTEAELN